VHGERNELRSQKSGKDRFRYLIQAERHGTRLHAEPPFDKLDRRSPAMAIIAMSAPRLQPSPVNLRRKCCANNAD
jgi:hypothetical protein